MAVPSVSPVRVMNKISDAFNKVAETHPELAFYTKVAAWIFAGAGVIKFCVNFQHRKITYNETLPDGTKIERMAEETIFSWGFGNSDKGEQHSAPSNLPKIAGLLQ